MDTGMLWFDDGPQVLKDKVARAVSFYATKYGRSPTVCLVHPATTGGAGGGGGSGGGSGRAEARPTAPPGPPAPTGSPEPKPRARRGGSEGEVEGRPRAGR